MSANVFKQLKKDYSKMKGVTISDGIPKFWIDTGNFALNKLISGRYRRGIPQGRMTCYTGPSGAGKSFALGNAITAAQRDDCSILIIDTENALDYDYLRAIGVDVEKEDFMRITLNEIDICTEACNTILKMYRDAKNGTEDMKKLFICIDSLDFLFLGHAMEAYEKTGTLSNDQGLHVKKLKQLLVTLMQDIQDLPVVLIATKQVYVNQEQHAFPKYKMAESLMFPFSQIVLFTRLFDRDATTRNIDGIRMKAFGWKTRFTKPFQVFEMTVPYATGLNPYEGLLEIAISLNIITKNGGWYVFEGKNFRGSEFDKIQERVLELLIEREDEALCVQIDEKEEIVPVLTEAQVKRQKLEELSLAET